MRAPIRRRRRSQRCGVARSCELPRGLRGPQLKLRAGLGPKTQLDGVRHADAIEEMGDLCARAGDRALNEDATRDRAFDEPPQEEAAAESESHRCKRRGPDAVARAER